MSGLRVNRGQGTRGRVRVAAPKSFGVAGASYGFFRQTMPAASLMWPS